HDRARGARAEGAGVSSARGPVRAALPACGRAGRAPDAGLVEGRSARARVHGARRRGAGGRRPLAARRRRALIESLLPHRGDALFLREVIAHDAGSIEAVATVPPRSPYATGGRADALLAFEIAAQAAAAWASLERRAAATA